MISEQQARKVAQLLFPELWESDRIEAVASTIVYLHAAAGEHAPQPVDNHGHSHPSPIIKTLADAMRRHKIHVKTIARALGVSEYTVRTWLEGKYRPNEDNTEKITTFLANSASTTQVADVT